MGKSKPRAATSDAINNPVALESNLHDEEEEEEEEEEERVRHKSRREKV